MPRWFVCFKLKPAKNTDIELIQTLPKKQIVVFSWSENSRLIFMHSWAEMTQQKNRKNFVAMIFGEFSANKQVKTIEKVFSL